MSDKTRLLVRADDAGSSWASNMGCLQACTEGIARSVEVMMPCAWVSHAATLFNQHPDIEIGIHLTLTSEWDSVKWRPLTQARSLVDPAGNFLPLLRPANGDGRASLLESNWAIDDIIAEFRAQIELGLAVFDHVTHVSAHMARNFSDVDSRIGTVVTELCNEYGLIEDPADMALPRIKGYPKYPLAARQRVSAFMEEVADIPVGTYIFIDHPAVDSGALTDTAHIGYEDVRDDRTSCLQTLISPELAQQIDKSNIELIGYKDI